jgi:hypothetical protein
MNAIFFAAAKVIGRILVQLSKLAGRALMMLLRWAFRGSAMTIVVKLVCLTLLVGSVAARAGLEDFAAPVMFVAVLVGIVTAGFRMKVGKI